MFSHLLKESRANCVKIMIVGIQPGLDMGVSRIVFFNLLLRFNPFHKTKTLNKVFCVAGVKSCEITQKT